MTLARLTRMGVTEIAVRGRQEAMTWCERIGLVGTESREEPRRARLLRPPDDLRAEAPVRFFTGATDSDVVRLLRERTPGHRERTLSEADALCLGRFDLLGHRGVSFGQPVDWHLDPLSGRRAPRVHWSRLDPLDPIGGGDCKLVWELNRHQWLVRLGQAYRLTGHERYASAFARYVHDWMEANPAGLGINWASSLEVGLRLISWCWALFLFSGSRALDAALRARLIGGIAAHASHVQRHLSYYSSPNTHLTGEALALFYAGALFPELRHAGRHRALGTHILEDEVGRQVLPDGVYFEQSTCYQRYTLEICLHLLILSSRSRHAVRGVVRERVERMLDFLLAIRRPDGSIPQIGDEDGGRLLPLDADGPEDLGGLLATAAALLRRADCAWAAGGPHPALLWLLGTDGLAAFDALRPEPPEGATSRLFPDGGYAVMASGRGPEAHQAIFDVGPLGCPVTAGHGHADLLSIQCAVFGDPYLVDPGTFCYTSQPCWRDHFRGSGAHNTVLVDGEGQARPAGPFSWVERPAARLRRWASTSAFDLADAEHDAYGRLPEPVTHRRRALFVKPRYWVVVDDLCGEGEHSVDLRFQFAPGIRLTLERPPWVAAHGPRGRGMLLVVFATAPLRPSLVAGVLDPIGGWVSPDYGRRLAAAQLSYRTEGRLPIRIATLLLPVDDPCAPPPRLAPLVGEGAALTGLVLEDGRQFILIDDEEILLEGG